MKNGILKARVSHVREGGSHSFFYDVFYISVDLLKIDEIVKPLLSMSHNGFNIFSFQSRDFVDFGKASIAENFSFWLQQSQPKLKLAELYLIAHPRTIGYSFNPISLFLYRPVGERVFYAVAEVHNTFGEAKMFSLGPLDRDGCVEFASAKNFYVSPFIPLDTEFVFKVRVTEDKISLRVDSHQNGHVILGASLVGDLIPLNNKNLLMSLLRNPHITAKVIGGIHLEALKLYLKKIPFNRKASNQTLQRNYYDRKHHSKYIS